MIIAIACLLTVGAILFVLGVRPKDLPEPEPVSPFQHLDERKASIYENLRDLQFEYRVGKLSDADYQATKKDLQKELAQVMAEVDRIKGELNVEVKSAPAAAKVAVNGTGSKVCPHCGAKFDRALKFCGECGKTMKVQA